MDKKINDEQLVTIAMQMILHAGNARNYVDEAFNCVKKFKNKEAQNKLKEAHEEIKLAHQAQTDVIQQEASGIQYAYSPLFTHAQDTLMTITSEINVTEKLISTINLLRIGESDE
ncbi:PTS lactose/cellobiose transporter subunit IIA [Tetragenococcus koreensis]|uniref:Cellobiose-specific PTS system IIA component n=1 Tax=Tetragenococcus koreensis TaxID=290335 RepID=A0AAN4UCZ6_9ENTE|nr:PTS lactose/cellobiose transporter subunit IIA [Tetragenococcus koreensis]MCF1628170.1 PTS lactose/cellobiose transporter subunit IIA [Tetragenococcus koreensis]GEQ50117.1 cellobiose-specific PTS system IIA component [Tetragenococcus koreensis]GEQ52632.1 cellobiose-specific PTS system IIA component [Tetragenococcus koreensis]GEQ55167.1 cellobiose-specific PTS system IIA component [Tetragenococcus koreensis]GEQ57633.1 cellobiose-specific PTS system IIA component [Tetragenococcus koreensis]